jgi:hypothetical protein
LRLRHKQICHGRYANLTAPLVHQSRIHLDDRCRVTLYYENTPWLQLHPEQFSLLRFLRGELDRLQHKGRRVMTFSLEIPVVKLLVQKRQNSPVDIDDAVHAGKMPDRSRRSLRGGALPEHNNGYFAIHPQEMLSVYAPAVGNMRGDYSTRRRLADERAFEPDGRVRTFGDPVARAALKS